MARVILCFLDFAHEQAAPVTQDELPVDDFSASPDKKREKKGNRTLNEVAIILAMGFTVIGYLNFGLVESGR